MGATVWSLWSRNKWWVLTPFFSRFLPLFVFPFYAFHKQRNAKSLFQVPLSWDPACLCSSPCSFSPGGWSELSTAGDLWDREQIQQPRIKGKIRHHMKEFSVCFSSSLSETTWQFRKINRTPRASWSFQHLSAFFNLQVVDDEISDNSAECVVCLSDVRDTLILPCRHLCLCNACADTLRYQANCCPICRLREFPPTPKSFHPEWDTCCWKTGPLSWKR